MKNSFDYLVPIPCLIIAKDINSRYLGGTQRCADLLGWKSPDNFIGKFDSDIPCDAAKMSPIFVKMDKEVIHSNKRMVSIECHHYASGYKLMLGERNPLNENNQCIGIICSAMDTTDSIWSRNYFSLHRFDKKYYGSKFRSSIYTLSHCHSPLKLTAKQENCLFFLIRGKTGKEIAKILNISHKTVESHLIAIKNKLHCQSTSELIEKTIDSGFLYYIPSPFLSSNSIQTL